MTTFVASTSGGPVDGTSGKDVIIGKSGDDIIDGGAGADVLLGGAGDDTIIYDEFDIKVDGGSGYDILLFKGTGQTLDLGLQRTVMNFERIDLAGGGGHSLTFSAADVLRTSDLDSLLIYGSRSSNVTFSDSGWTFQGYGDGLSKFGNGSAIAYIDNAVYVTGFSENAVLQQFGASSVTEDLNPDSFGDLVASGTISVSDPNVGQSMMLDQVTAIGSPLGTLTLLPGLVPGISNGSYRYTVANAATQYLAETEERTEDFTVKSVDGSILSLSFTIGGVNDAPVRADSTSQSASVSEITDHASGENATTSTRTGSFIITDVDLSDSLYCWIESPNGNHGTLSVESISAPSATGERTVSWTYVVTDASLDKLRDAEFDETHTIHLSDRVQGTAGATVVDVAVQVNLQGANDGVELLSVRSGIDVLERTVSEASNTTGSSTTQSLEFQFQARDVDLEDTFSISSTGTSLSNPPIGTLGSGNVSNYDPQTGTRDVQYTFQYQDSMLDFLGQNQTLDKQFQVSVSDLQTTEYQTITLHFVGANDAPVLQSTGNTTSGTVTEIADKAAGENTTSHQVTGSFTVRDVDKIDTLSSWIVNPATPRGTLSVTSITNPDANGDRVVNWQYVVADSALDSLRALSTSENYSIKVSDRTQGTGGATVLDIPIAITLNGANDAPVRHVVSADVLAGSVTELAASNANANSTTFIHQATGSFQVQDVDIGDPLTTFSILQSSSNSVLYGNLVVDNISTADVSGIRTVHWTYSVSDHDLDPLPAGSGPTQTFSVRLTDGPSILTQNVTISLTGAADGPSFGGDKIKNVSEFNDGDYLENFGVHTVSGTVTATNMPAGSLLVEQVGFPGDFSLGSFYANTSAIDANGNATINWTYVVADCLLDVLNGGGLSDNVQLLITHSANAQITQSVSIALAGVLDHSNSPEVTFTDAPNHQMDYSTIGFPSTNYAALQVYGLDGNDTFRTGSEVPQTLFGGDGDDDFKLSSGLVSAVGGTGNDRFDFNAGSSTVYAWGQQGTDTFDISDADPNAKLWAMDFTLGVDRIVTNSDHTQFHLTLEHTSATDFSSEGYNPNVADGTPYYLLVGPNATNQTIYFHIIGSELPSVDAALILA